MFSTGAKGIDVVDGDEGKDTAEYAKASAAVTVNLSTSTVSGADGADSLVEIESLSGSKFGDRLTGDALSNVLKGLDGNDRIFGLDGADNLQGGVGNDLLDGGTGSDRCKGGPGSNSLKSC